MSTRRQKVPVESSYNY